MTTLESIDFKSLIAKETNGRMRVRLMALSHIKDGANNTQAARNLHISRRIVNDWVKKFYAQGLDGLKEKPRSGRPCGLDQQQLTQLSEYIRKNSIKESGGRLKAQTLVTYIAQEFTIEYTIFNVYRLLHQLGFSWITSRSRHPKQSIKIQEDFKKFEMEMILTIPWNVRLKNVDVWFQDEARFGQKNTTTRLWAIKGTRPRAVKQQQFEYAYLFGAVCPATGDTEALIAPCMNMDVMEKHLALISKRIPEGRHGVIVVDGAAWHQAYLADKFDNLSIIKLPPYSPELNPIEQVWQWLRQNELANRCFNGYDDIVDECSRAWNSFISDASRVMKLCDRDWIKVGT
nr:MULTISPECIES: IS630 family transposase [Colwellia]